MAPRRNYKELHRKEAEKIKTLTRDLANLKEEVNYRSNREDKAVEALRVAQEQIDSLSDEVSFLRQIVRNATTKNTRHSEHHFGSFGDREGR